jgi:hypothetical protein
MSWWEQPTEIGISNEERREKLKHEIADILKFYDKLTGVNVSYMTVAEQIMQEIEKE